MGFPREYNRKKQSRQKKWHRCGQIEHSQMQEICPRHFESHGNVQDDLQHRQDDHRICHAQSRGQPACVHRAKFRL